MLRRLRITEYDFFPQNNCIYSYYVLFKIRRIGFRRIGTEPAFQSTLNPVVTSFMYDILHCVSKMHQLWNGIPQNDKDRFWWHLAQLVKRSSIKFDCFSFHTGLLVITLSSLKLHAENITCMLCASVSCWARLFLQPLRRRSLWIIRETDDW